MLFRGESRGSVHGHSCVAQIYRQEHCQILQMGQPTTLWEILHSTPSILQIVATRISSYLGFQGDHDAISPYVNGRFLFGTGNAGEQVCCVAVLLSFWRFLSPFPLLGPNYRRVNSKIWVLLVAEFSRFRLVFKASSEEVPVVTLARPRSIFSELPTPVAAPLALARAPADNRPLGWAPNSAGTPGAAAAATPAPKDVRRGSFLNPLLPSPLILFRRI